MAARPRSTVLNRRNAIPILFTAGTYYEVGFDIGRTFRGLIEDFLDSSEYLHDFLLPAYKDQNGREAYDATMSSLHRNFPHYVRELRGTADGAKVPFLHLMLLLMDEIVPKNSAMNKTNGLPAYGCSTAFCTNDSQVILGHTEDADANTLNNLYIVSAHIKEDEPQGRWQTKEEKFTALCYAGHLPGFCMSYNHHGFVYSINVIYPQVVLAGKTPRHILTRALLAADSLERVLDILRDKGTGCSDGLSVNAYFAKNEDARCFHNIEVGPAEAGEESVISVLGVKPGEHSFHANRYERLTVIEEERKSSIHRMATANRRSTLDSRHDILDLLSDTSDEEFPIFREGIRVDSVNTVAVGVFDMLQKDWSIWIQKPSNGDPLCRLPLIFRFEN